MKMYGRNKSGPYALDKEGLIEILKDENKYIMVEKDTNTLFIITSFYMALHTSVKEKATFLFPLTSKEKSIVRGLNLYYLYTPAGNGLIVPFMEDVCDLLEQDVKYSYDPESLRYLAMNRDEYILESKDGKEVLVKSLDKALEMVRNDGYTFSKLYSLDLDFIVDLSIKDIDKRLGPQLRYTFTE